MVFEITSPMCDIPCVLGRRKCYGIIQNIREGKHLYNIKCLKNSSSSFCKLNILLNELYPIVNLSLVNFCCHWSLLITGYTQIYVAFINCYTLYWTLRAHTEVFLLNWVIGT